MAKAYRRLPDFPEQVINRFHGHVNRSDGDNCWEWKSALLEKGYGAFQYRGLTYRAHRVAYFISRGRDPAELEVCHRCDNPKCCRPDHLFLGTRQDNIDDCGAKGRRYRGEQHHFKRNPPIGDKNGRTIATPEIVRAIRSAYIPRKTSQIELGKRYGLSRSAVSGILSGKNWKHLD